MKFNQNNYISQYQKKNYKMFAFRIKKSDKEVIEKINGIKNKNEYFVNLIKQDIQSKDGILTLRQIKDIIIPILNKRNVREIYLFGSYARGEATTESDIDIYCEKGNIKDLYDVVDLNEELKKALNKNVDIIFNTSKLEETFEENMKRDLIKLC